jgi:hypothetical protein
MIDGDILGHVPCNIESIKGCIKSLERCFFRRRDPADVAFPLRPLDMIAYGREGLARSAKLAATAGSTATRIPLGASHPGSKKCFTKPL